MLEKSTFRLAVLGPWNSGKSCIVNRLLDENPQTGLLPVDDKPCSAKLTQIKFGKSPQVSKLWDDGTVENLSEGTDCCRRTVKREGASKGEGVLLVDWPAALLKAGGILIDTPGLFDPDEERSLVTLEALARFHGVIFVVPADMPVDESILKFLEDCLTRKTSSKFFYLINKIDRLTLDDGPVEEHVDWCFKEIAKRLNEQVAETSFAGTKIESSLVKRERFFGVSGLYGQGLDEVWRELVG